MLSRNYLFSRFSGCLALATMTVFSFFGAYADITFTDPNGTDVAACSDYGYDVLYDAWDYSEESDFPTALPPRHFKELSSYSVANGLLSLISASTSPSNAQFSLTTWDDYNAAIPEPKSLKYGANFPIDVSRYKKFNIKLKTDQDSFFQLIWDGTSASSSYGITSPVYTTAGQSRVYSVDLTKVGIQEPAGTPGTWAYDNKRGLRIRPTSVANSNLEVDWVTLTPLDADCPVITATFNDTANGAALVYLDQDTNLSNGFNAAEFVATTVGTNSVDFSTTRTAIGEHKVYGYSSLDYAALLTTPWDFDSTTDIISSSGMTSSVISGGDFAFTAGIDSQFFLNVSEDFPIDTSVFGKLIVDMTVTNGNNGVAEVFWFDQDGGLVGVKTSPTAMTNGSYRIEFDLNSDPSWNDGDVYNLRIDPINHLGNNAQISIEYVALIPNANTFTDLTAEPTVPMVASAPGNLNVVAGTGDIVQPDQRGGRDCPTHDFGNPWVMDSEQDVQFAASVNSPQIYPYNDITDALGFTKTGDYFTATSYPAGQTSAGDPKLFPILFSKEIDADRCIHACYSMVMNQAFSAYYHSVGRITYQTEAGVNQNGDDVVNPFGWEYADVCLQLNQMKQEPDLTPGQVHPWAGDINFFSLDPHEEEFATQFYVDYIELREHHKSNTKYSLSVNTPLSQEVRFYSSTAAPSNRYALNASATLIGTLASGRNSNVFNWDTSAVAPGTYYISVQILHNASISRIRHAKLPIVVDTSSTQDATAPTLMIDSPSASAGYNTYVNVAGAAFDDTRISTVEFLIDGVWKSQTSPSLHHKAARDTYPTLAPNSPGFIENISLSGVSTGSHTLTINAYDTAGNVSTQTISFTKGASQTADYSYPAANAAAVNFSPSDYTLSVQQTGTSSLSFDLGRGFNACTGTKIEGAQDPDFKILSPLMIRLGGGSFSATNVPQLVPVKQKLPKCKKCAKCKNKKDKKCAKARKKCLKKFDDCQKRRLAITSNDGVAYFRAICGVDESSQTAVSSIDFKNSVSNPANIAGYEVQIMSTLQTQLSAQ